MYCHDHNCYSANWCILCIACGEVLKGQFTQIRKKQKHILSLTLVVSVHVDTVDVCVLVN